MTTLLLALLACVTADRDDPGDSAAPDTAPDEPDSAEETGASDTAEAPAVAEEECGGRDEDRDGEVDEDGAIGCVDRYEDADGDGVGTGEAWCVCDALRGAPGDDDCDDTDPDMTTDCALGPIEPLSPDAMLVGTDANGYLGSPRPTRLADGSPAWWVTSDVTRLVAAPSTGSVEVEASAVASVDAWPWGVADVDASCPAASPAPPSSPSSRSGSPTTSWRCGRRPSARRGRAWSRRSGPSRGRGARRSPATCSTTPRSCAGRWCWTSRAGAAWRASRRRGRARRG